MLQDRRFETFCKAVCRIVSRWYPRGGDVASEHLSIDVVVFHVDVLRDGRWVCNFGRGDDTGIVHVKESWYGGIEGTEVT